MHKGAWSRVGVLAAALFVTTSGGALAAVPDNVGVLDTDSGEWHLRNADGTQTDFYFGNPGDANALMGDWDGDGDETPGLYRDGSVLLRNSNDTGGADVTYIIGQAGDIAVAGDWDGDGDDTVSVFRPSQSRAFVANVLGSGGAPVAGVGYLLDAPGTIPFAGDFNNDGIDTFGLYDSTTATVSLWNSHSGGAPALQFSYGNSGDDQAFAGDWNGNATAAPGVFRFGAFFLSNVNAISTGIINFFFGDLNDIAFSWNPGDVTAPGGGPINRAPFFTSSPSFTVPENQTSVGTVTATDPDADSVTFSKTGGADQAKLAISASGVLTFLAAPDFDSPADADSNNVYEVEITATDTKGGVSKQLVKVTVTNINEAPVITSDGGGAAASKSVPENTTFVTNVDATDPEGETESGGGLSYSLSGTDGAEFSITPAGLLSFAIAPDFETPGDSDGDNAYDVTVTVTDSGGLTDSQAITVTVTDVAETGDIVIFKQTAPVGGTGFGFTGDLGAFSLDDGGFVAFTLPPGIYSVTETVPAGWDLTSATCDDGSPVTAIDLSAGETIVCLFQNIKRGSITVVKNAVPDDPQDFSFTSNVLGHASFDLDDDPGDATLPNTRVMGNVQPGTYNVAETVPAGWDLTSATCNDGSLVTAIGVSPGESVTCTFTNTKRGSITIVKNTVGGNDTFGFTGTLGAFDLTTVAGTDSTTFNNLVPGTFTVTENDPNAVGFPPGYTLTGLSCVDPDGGSSESVPLRQATIDLDPGETVTCTFTNTINNTPPTLDLDADDSGGASPNFAATFTEDGGPVSVADDVDITDAEDANMASASATISNVQDVGIELLQLNLVSCAPITVGGAGTPTVTLTGPASIADFEACLGTLTYENTSQDPTAAPARTIDITVNDGTVDSPTRTTTVTVMPVNDVPTLDLDADDSGGASPNFAATFTEDGGPVSVADDVDITDAEDANMASASATISNVQDVGIELLQLNLVSCAPITVGGAGTPTVTLTGPASIADFEACLGTLTYENTSQDPTAAPARTIDITVNDGTVDSPTRTTTVTVMPVNDVPTLDLDADDSGGASPNFAATFTEDGGPVSVADDVDITDAEDANMASASATISNVQDVGIELLQLNLVSCAPITVGGAGTPTVTLTGPASIADFEACLGTLTYENTSQDPTAAPARTIDITVNDGTVDSPTRTTTVTVMPVNDVPTAVDDGYTGLPVNVLLDAGGVTTSGIEVNDSEGVLTKGTDDSDPEGATLTVTKIQATVVPGGGSATATTTGGGSVTMNSDGTFTYISELGETAATDTFTYEISDGALPNTGTVTITFGDTIWFIDNGVSGGTNDGRSTSPFESIGAFNAATTGTGDLIFLHSGTYTDDGIDLLNSQELIGEEDGLTSGNLTIAAGTAPVLAPPTGNGIDLASGNTVRGLNIGNTAAADHAMSGTTVGSLTVSNVDVSGTGGIIDLSTGGTLAITFDSVASTSSSGTAGINLTNVSGSFTVSNPGAGTDTSITAADAGISIQGSNATFSFGETVVTTNANGGAGIDLSSSGTATFTFDSLSVTTSAGTGLRASTAGTVNIGGTTNTISATGGAALDVTSTSLGAGNWTFASVSSSTSSGKGISLNGASGNVTVTGAPGTTTVSGATGIGIDIDNGGSNAHDFGLTTVGSAATGIDLTTGNSSATFTFDSLSVTTTAGAGLVANSSGTVNIGGSGNTISASGGPALDVTSTSLGAGNWTFASVSSSTSSGKGINLNAASGSLTVTGTTAVSSAAGTGIDVDNGGSNAFDFGLTTIGSAGIGIDLTTSGTASFTFDSLSVTTSAGAGLRANGSGTVNIGGTTNTISATGGPALDVVSTSLGGGATFASLASTSSSTDGIRLDSITGDLTVTGTTTITNSTNDSIEIDSSGATVDYTFATVDIDNNTSGAGTGAHDGIDLDGVTGSFTINSTGGGIEFTGAANDSNGIFVRNSAGLDITISGVSGSTPGDPCTGGGANCFVISGMSAGTGAADAHGIDIRGADTVSITGVKVSNIAQPNSNDDAMRIDATTTSVSVTNSECTDTDEGDCVGILNTSTVVPSSLTNQDLSVTITGNRFQGNGTDHTDTTGFGVDLVYESTLGASGSTLTATISNNTIRDLTRGISVLTEGDAGRGGSGNMITINNNTIKEFTNDAIDVAWEDAVVTEHFITNNVIDGEDGIAPSDSDRGIDAVGNGNFSGTVEFTITGNVIDDMDDEAIRVRDIVDPSTGTVIALIDNNTITTVNDQAIVITNGPFCAGCNMSLDATITNNVIKGTITGEAITADLDAGTNTMCVNISGNSNGAGGSPDSSGPDILLERFGGGALNVTQASEVALQNANPSAGSPATTSVLSVTFGGGTCATP